MAFKTFLKPIRGDSLRERKAQRREHDDREHRIMRAAKKRDGWACRFPKCPFQDLPIDACHLRHRGMGGNQAGDRTALDSVICLCRRHHGLFDQAFLRIKPLTRDGTNGRCAFSERQPGTDEYAYRGQS